MTTDTLSIAIQPIDDSSPQEDLSKNRTRPRRPLTPLDSTFYLIERENNQLPLRYFDQFDIK